MYNHTVNFQKLANFELPFGGELSKDNRWVVLSGLIPWDEIETVYRENFRSRTGPGAKPARIAFGSLYIKERLRLSDEEVVEQLRENPYLQFFVGLEVFSNKAPFDPSMMVHFRKRFSGDFLKKINEKIIEETIAQKPASKDDEDSEGDSGGGNKNKGKLVLDASCAPADISYPTDLNLLNKSREKLERIIDRCYEEVSDSYSKKPRTYRKLARKNYLSVAKSKRVTAKKRRKCIRKQLCCIKRNLGHIDDMLSKKKGLLTCLSSKQYRDLLVTSELYRQQSYLYANKVTRVDDRIVSISQPHVRPIVRGKARSNVEFGAKISISCTDRYVSLDRVSSDNYCESRDLKLQVEAYKSRHGYYPESIHVDQIYRTRENRKWCKEREIRMSGPALGRKPKKVSAQEKKQSYQDEVYRNCVEGKFGQAKRRYGLGQIMTKLAGTSVTAISMTFIVMNLEKMLAKIFFGLLLVYFYSKKGFKQYKSLLVLELSNLFKKKLEITYAT